MKRFFTELSLFFFSLATAYFMGWNNTDLIWSFWITSLVVGYVSIFRTSAEPIFILAKSILNPVEIKKFRELQTIEKLKIFIFVLIFIPVSLFYIVFLSFHFCIFLLLIAYWLQVLMPHSKITDILANGNGDGFYIYIQVIKTLFMSYWIVIVGKLIFDYRTFWKSGSNKVTRIKKARSNEFFSFEGIKRPYVQVVRIIILMVLLFWLNSIEVNQYLIYVVIYSLFFFPIPTFGKFKVIKNLWRKKCRTE